MTAGKSAGATGGKWDPDGVRLRDPGTGKHLRTFPSEQDTRHAGGAECMAFSPDGCQLAVADNDEDVERWFLYDNSEAAPAGSLARVRLWG